MFLLQISWLLSVCLFMLPRDGVAALDQTEMQTHLQAGARLLGTYEDSSQNLTNWMASVDDATPIQRLSIMGSHDSLSWNIKSIVSPFVKTQDVPLFQQLNNGSRFVDLRIGIDSDRIRLYHSDYMLDDTADLNDIFWGMYYWLDHHPTETVLVSVKVDNGNNTAVLQQQLFDWITAEETSSYWSINTTLPTLGDARGKLVLVRRFALNSITNYRPIGINLSSAWKDNNADITMSYGGEQVVFIEDLYNLDVASLGTAIDTKYNVLTTNLNRALNDTDPNHWYISFASGYSGVISTPDDIATGSSLLKDHEGMNTRVLDYLVANRGAYFGVVLVDFFGHDLRLVKATLGWEVESSATRLLPGYGTIISLLVLVYAFLG